MTRTLLPNELHTFSEKKEGWRKWGYSQGSYVHHLSKFRRAKDSTSRSNQVNCWVLHTNLSVSLK